MNKKFGKLPDSASRVAEELLAWRVAQWTLSRPTDSNDQ